MGKYVYIYYAGKDAAAANSMEPWNAWFGELGDKLIDAGNPFGGAGKVVHEGGVMDTQGPPATGYTIVKAESVEEATKMAQGCPLVTLKVGAVGVYEALPM